MKSTYSFEIILSHMFWYGTKPQFQVQYLDKISWWYLATSDSNCVGSLGARPFIFEPQWESNSPIFYLKVWLHTSAHSYIIDTAD